MKLLFILPDLPYPASNGFRQKLLTLLSYLATRHDCDILALGSEADVKLCEPWLLGLPRLRILGVFPPDPISFSRVLHIFALVWSKVVGLPPRHPSRDLRSALKHAINEENYDVVHIDLISNARYCRDLGSLKRVLSLNDSLSLTMFGRFRNEFASFLFRLGALGHGFLQLRVDRTLFGLADAVHFVGPRDAAWSRTRLGARNAVFIPLAVHTGFLCMKTSADSRRRSTLVIVEKLWDPQHRKAVEKFLSVHWSTLLREHPHLRLIVIGGKGMPPSFSRFIDGLPGVELYEWVERLEDVLAGAAIAVFPYSVEVGMKTRVLQCMAAQNAAVGTTDAFSGIPVRDGVEAVVSENHADMARGIAKLLADPALCRRIGENARQFIRARFDEEIIGHAWEELYQDVATGLSPRSSYGAESERIDP